jgi:hypothetical protein
MEDQADDEGRVSRRTVIRRAAKVGAVAWTAPLIIDSFASPAAAATCAAGSFNVVYQGSLTQIPPTTACSGTTGTNTAAANVGLTATGGPIGHVASTTGNSNPVRLSIAGGCSCVITAVRAHVHRRGAPTNPDCPNPACQSASNSATAPLRRTAGAFNSSTVTVAPNYNSNLCGNAGIHWGSPSQPGGYMVVQITCT